MENLDANSNSSEVRDYVYHNPLALLLLSKEEDINMVNHMLPYSTGFEIECHRGKFYSLESFKNIPFIMEVNNDMTEQRYRIPNGINGFLCLYMISLNLKICSELNPLSGIHYHVDRTDYLDISIDDTSWVLDELDSWGYKGTYNARMKGSWFRKNNLGTIEYRTGEMTFDYKILVKRIIHVNAITRKIKEQNQRPYDPKFSKFEKEAFVNYIEANKISEAIQESYNRKKEEILSQIRQSKVVPTKEVVSDNEIIKNRIIRI